MTTLSTKFDENSEKTLENISIRENLRALLLYNDIGCERSKAENLDLILYDLKDLTSQKLQKSDAKGITQVFPVLLNGSNKYDFIKNIAYKDQLPSFLRGFDFKNNSFVIIPEQQTLIDIHSISQNFQQSFLKYTRRGLLGLVSSSLANNYQNVDDNCVYMDLTSQLLSEYSSYDLLRTLRLFDSHLSIYAYAKATQLIVKKYLNLSMDEIYRKILASVVPRSYLPDLSSRFSDKQNVLSFGSSKYCINEQNNSNSNRGMICEYKNESYLDPRHLILIGDSHSYSGLAPLLSQFFQCVTFLWGSYQEWEEIYQSPKYANKQCILIIEIAERFYLNNYAIC